MAPQEFIHNPANSLMMIPRYASGIRLNAAHQEFQIKTTADLKISNLQFISNRVSFGSILNSLAPRTKKLWKRIVCKEDLVLLIAGTQSKYVSDTEEIHKQLAPGLCSMIKVENVTEPLKETPAKVAEAVLLFCQVCMHSIRMYISVCIHRDCVYCRQYNRSTQQHDTALELEI